MVMKQDAHQYNIYRYSVNDPKSFGAMAPTAGGRCQFLKHHTVWST